MDDYFGFNVDHLGDIHLWDPNVSGYGHGVNSYDGGGCGFGMINGYGFGTGYISKFIDGNGLVHFNNIRKYK